MPAAIYNLKIEQGIPYKKTLTLTDSLNAPYPLTGYTARMHFRTSVGSSTIILNCSTENGRLEVEPGGIIKINLSETDTESLVFTKYVYDLEIVNASLEPLRLLQGSVLVSLEVTREG